MLRFAIISLLSAAAFANQDNYYSDDLFEAIEQARKYSHHYDYSQPYRYNRTTSQSIDIPRLLNQEMAQKYVMTPDEVDLQGNPQNAGELRSDKPLNTAPNTTTGVATGSAASVSVRVSVR
ncbi:hypothetical protein [Bacterioplanes sanyensis]|nr:hypothetical protein [Bacterioplanes sanyensis]